MIRRVLALAAALSCFACGSTIDVGQSSADAGGSGTDAGPSGPDTGTPSLAPGTADVTGSVNGNSFVVKDAAGAVSRGSQVDELWVDILDHADICAAVQQGAEGIASTTGVRLTLLSASPTLAAIGTGTFAIGDTSMTKPHFAARFLKTDASCNDPVVAATAGTMTVSEITATAIHGTFDITFPSGSLKGSFGARVCGPSSGTIKCAQ